MVPSTRVVPSTHVVPGDPPTQARALFTQLFARARRVHAMVAYEQDFVADNTLRYGRRGQRLTLTLTLTLT